MEQEPVYCPGCGHEMAPEIYRCTCVMVCEKCGWASPCKEGETPEEAETTARAAARERFRPMRRPMTEQEVRAHVGALDLTLPLNPEELLKYAAARPLCMEINPAYAEKWQTGGNGKTRFLWCVSATALDMLMCMKEGPEKYGQAVRFWWDKPTEEEQKAAKWEDYPGGN